MSVFYQLVVGLTFLLFLALLFQAVRSVFNLILEMRTAKPEPMARSAPANSSIGVFIIDRYGTLEAREER